MIGLIQIVLDQILLRTGVELADSAKTTLVQELTSLLTEGGERRKFYEAILEHDRAGKDLRAKLRTQQPVTPEMLLAFSQYQKCFFNIISCSTNDDAPTLKYISQWHSGVRIDESGVLKVED